MNRLIRKILFKGLIIPVVISILLYVATFSAFLLVYQNKSELSTIDLTLITIVNSVSPLVMYSIYVLHRLISVIYDEIYERIISESIDTILKASTVNSGQIFDVNQQLEKEFSDEILYKVWRSIHSQIEGYPKLVVKSVVYLENRMSINLEFFNLINQLKYNTTEEFFFKVSEWLQAKFKYLVVEISPFWVKHIIWINFILVSIVLIINLT